MFILASKSPRRAELLKKIYNKEFIIDPTDADESKIKNIDPSDTSLAIALLKMNEAIKKHPNDTILTADTIVIQNGTIYGKPKTKVDAINMLNNLCGVPHQVITGYAIAINGKIVAQNKTVTNLTLKRMSSNEIENYIATGSPFDKAGGYGIQDTEYIKTDKIDGSFANVMGLPIEDLKQEFIKLKYRQLTTQLIAFFI